MKAVNRSELSCVPFLLLPNENTNGLIRQFVPKQTDIAELRHQRIKEFENLLNEQPRKRHGFKTPNEVFTGTVTKPCYV